MPVEESLFPIPKSEPQPAPQPAPSPAPAPAATVPTQPTSARIWMIAGGAGAAFAIVLFAVSLVLLLRPSTSDSTFVSLGRTYAAQGLAVGHAGSLEKAAGLLEKGESLKSAFDQAHADFDSSRAAAWQSNVESHLEAIVPKATPEKDITPNQRAALARALRSIAKGERGTR